MVVRALSFLAVSLLACSVGHAQLLVDFNSTNQDGGPHNDDAGATVFQAYDAGHEVAADLGENSDPGKTESYSAFGTTIRLTPDWPNTVDVRVRQSIDRTSQAADPPTGFDSAWTDGPNTNLATPEVGLNLITDFLGIDTRTGNGGNGDWSKDPSTGELTGVPTYMTLTLSGLPANSYKWTSAHHDTEYVHNGFAVSVSTDGGASFAPLADGVMTNSSDGGDPNSAIDVVNTLEMIAAGSLYEASFTADGTNDVVMQFAPYAQTGVHERIWGINGLMLEAVPEPASVSLLLLACCGGFGLLRRRK